MSIPYGEALIGFTFNLDDTQGEPVTTGSVIGYITRDNLPQVPLVNSPTYKGNGQWAVDITAAEMSASVIGLVFVHPDAINEPFTLVTTAYTQETAINIVNAANTPLRVKTDEGYIEERSIDELIKADRYAAGRTADAIPWGIRMARVRPGGTVDYP